MVGDSKNSDLNAIETESTVIFIIHLATSFVITPPQTVFLTDQSFMTYVTVGKLQTKNELSNKSAKLMIFRKRHSIH